MILRKHLVMYRVYRHILNIIFHCLFLYILGTHLTYKVVCYSKYSTLNSSYFLYFCLSLTLSSFSHLSLFLCLSHSFIFIVYWTLDSLYSFCWTLLDFTFSSTSLVHKNRMSQKDWLFMQIARSFQLYISRLPRTRYSFPCTNSLFYIRFI